MTTSGIAAGVILMCVLSEGFFSGSEIAIVSSNWIRMRRLASGGDRRAALLERLWRNPDRLLATTLVGTNLSVITGSVTATYLIIKHLTAQGALLSSMAGREEFLVYFNGLLVVLNCEFRIHLCQRQITQIMTRGRKISCARHGPLIFG